jgi:hypothetical protein
LESIRKGRRDESALQSQNAFLGMFGGKVQLRPAETKPGERPYLVARLGLNRAVLLEAAAGAAGCMKVVAGARFNLYHAFVSSWKVMMRDSRSTDERALRTETKNSGAGPGFSTVLAALDQNGWIPGGGFTPIHTNPTAGHD